MKSSSGPADQTRNRTLIVESKEKSWDMKSTGSNE